jgi:serine protease Do
MFFTSCRKSQNARSTFRNGVFYLVASCILGHGSSGISSAQPSLGQALKDIETADHWIYDDLPRAVAEAKRSRKPLLVVLRCVPCPPGKTLDLAVAQPDSELAEIEKQFVCVRIIKTNGLDLDLFQYDYDMSWSAMFLNAGDMTIYGRYGTRYSSGPGSDANLSVAAFRKTAERVLALHKEYPANKSSLSGKKGKPVVWKRPELTPGLIERHAVPVTRQSCIHCHMVKEFALRAKWQQGKLTEKDLFTYPAPARIGLTLDIDDGLIAKTVEAGSPAAEAGIKVGDVLSTAAGQPLVSTADLVWVLHTSPDEAQLPLTLERGGEPVNATLKLSGDWKRSDIAWRGSSWFALRQGLKTQPLPPPEKEKLGLSADALALKVEGMFGKGAAPLQKAGLMKGDVIVSLGGQTGVMNESEFLVHLRTKYGPNDAIKLTVLRGGARKDLNIPLW